MYPRVVCQRRPSSSPPSVRPSAFRPDLPPNVTERTGTPICWTLYPPPLLPTRHRRVRHPDRAAVHCIAGSLFQRVLHASRLPGRRGVGSRAVCDIPASQRTLTRIPSGRHTAGRVAWRGRPDFVESVFGAVSLCRHAVGTRRTRGRSRGSLAWRCSLSCGSSFHGFDESVLKSPSAAHSAFVDEWNAAPKMLALQT